MDTQTDHYRKQFYQETREILERVGDDLLRAEADPENHELLNAIFRDIHTIKGSAGVFGFDAIADFAHYLESILNALRSGRIELTPELTDILLSGTDQIGKMTNACEAGEDIVIDKKLTEQFASLCLETLRQPTSDLTPGPSPKRSGEDAEYAGLPHNIRQALEEQKKQGKHICKVSLRYTSDLLENGYDPLVFLKSLKASSEVYHAVNSTEVPPTDSFEPFALYLNPTIYVATDLSPVEICNLSFDPSLIEAVQIEAEIAPEMANLTPEILKEFIETAAETLESLEKAVMEYESSGSSESLNRIFRCVHTIKGDADFIGLQKTAAFAHVLESLLDQLRLGKIERNAAMTDLVLKASDFLRHSISALEKDGSVLPMPPIFDTLKKLTHEDVRLPLMLQRIPPNFREAFDDQLSQYKDIFVHFARPVPIDEHRRSVIRRALKSLSKAAAFLELDELCSYTEKTLSAASDNALSDGIAELLAFIERPMVIKKPDDVQKDPQIYESKIAAGREVRTMRIDEQKVEQFTNMVNELLIARNTYSHLVSQLRDDDGTQRRILKSMKENLHLFSRLANDMHHGVMSLRMIPIKGIFQKFNRLVRDMSRRQKKQIELITEGDEIEIDKKISDMLTDPLVHLIRNACDHGIERPEERKALGKPGHGRITLSASKEGSSLHIRVTDDGRGIDRQKLAAKAADAGMEISGHDADAVLNLMFMPGVSTADEVSDISGRGVGMDVVRTTVQSLGGHVKAMSEYGKGTEIMLSIPTSLGIDTVLFVEASGNSYAIPLEYIIETLKFSSKKIRRAGRQKLFYYRGNVIPVEYLKDILSGTLSETSVISEDEEISLVLVKTALGNYGVIIDRLGRNTEVAIKPVPQVLSGNRMIGGVSIMGDGKVFLVLNPDKFF